METVSSAASVYDERPWLRLYDTAATDLDVEHDSALAMFQAAARRSPDTVLLRYFDAALTMSEVDEISGALAAALVDRGFRVGDRTAVYLQNVPQFVLAMLGIWKAGGIMVPINPMNRERELEVILNDAGACTLVCEEMLYRDVAAAVLPKTSVRSVLTTSPLDYVTDPNPRVFG
ncbi:MAG: AMP-binding protein, partial [Streptosporangiaceae bacterium]